MPSGLTPQLPLTRGTENDYVLIKSYKDLVKQNFKNLLLTIPGERVMNLDFGVGLNQFLFEMDDPSLYANIAEKIKDQVKKYLPYLRIDNIAFDSAATNESMDLNSLFVSLEYTIKPLSEMDKLELSLPDN